MPGHVDWNPEPFRSSLDRELYRRVGEVGTAGRTQTRRLIDTPGSRGRYSAPGQPPFRQSGQLSRSIDFRTDSTPDSVFVSIGSPLILARFLERGTGRMRPRPFLTRMLAENLGRFRSILVHGR